MKDLRRKPRSPLNHLFFIQPYQCLNCSYKIRKLRFSWSGFLRISLIFAVLGAILFFAIKPQWFHRDGADAPNDAEALARARSSAGQLSTFEQMMIHKPRVTLDNATIVQLWKANVDENVVLQMIKNSNNDFDLSANAVIELKQAGVPQTILLAMIDASYGAR